MRYLFAFLLMLILFTGCKKERCTADIPEGTCAEHLDTTLAYQFATGKWFLRREAASYVRSPDAGWEKCYTDNSDYLEILPDRTINIYENGGLSRTIMLELVADSNQGVHNKTSIVLRSGIEGLGICENVINVSHYNPPEMYWAIYSKD